MQPQQQQRQPATWPGNSLPYGGGQSSTPAMVAMAVYLKKLQHYSAFRRTRLLPAQVMAPRRGYLAGDVSDEWDI
jgi:hypothetical protein